MFASLRVVQLLPGEIIGHQKDVRSRVGEQGVGTAAMTQRAPDRMVSLLFPPRFPPPLALRTVFSENIDCLDLDLFEIFVNCM